MLNKRMGRRDVLRLIGLAAFGTVIAACTKPTPEPAVETQPTVAPAKEQATAAPTQKEWTLLIDGGAPTDPSIELQEGERRVVGLQPAADDYMALKPNVKIEWYYFPPGSNRLEWLNARMTAQDCPDTFWMNADDLWPHVNKGWALDMTEYVNSPNPYMEGKREWASYIDEVGRLSQIGPDGKVYGINLDGAGVLWVYNKEAFANAGITEIPTTMMDFLSACDKLKAQDYIPIGGDFSEQCCYVHWTHGHVFGWLAWDNIYDFDDNKDYYVTAKEMVQHYQKGDFPLWEEFTKLAEIFKMQEPYLPLGYQGNVDYRLMFRQGKIGTYMEGNWMVMSFIEDPPPFEYDWMFYPRITKDIWPKAPDNKTVRLQGPWGGLQFHVPGYLTKTDPERIPVIMDFLMFITQPKYVEAFCAERGNVPMVEGAEAIPEIALFRAPYDRAVPYQSWNSLSASAFEQERALLAEYVGGAMTNDALVAKGKEIWEEEVRKLLESNPDWKI